MSLGLAVTQHLAQETRALLTRLARLQPFVLYETMVPAAAASMPAQAAIESYLERARQGTRRQAHGFLAWLSSPRGRQAPPAEAQRRFTLLRMQFNLMLSQFDIFADVMTQRSEHETGVWLAGLDDVASDALKLPGGFYRIPPVVCYLDRGHGAAIRRARTRLPGGGENPAAVIRVPRERMIGMGIASSLVHEAGHQGAALLDLVRSLRPVLCGLQHGGGDQRLVWGFWERWISEIISDFWSVSRVGIAAPLGLMGVVSLPRAFVFRVSLDDPHPIPWIRVKLSCAMGQALYPNSQWQRLAAVWQACYPTTEMDARRLDLLTRLERSMPAFVQMLVNHRPRSLRGASLGEVMADPGRRPENLRRLYASWQVHPAAMRQAAPTLVFAAIGQARADGQIAPEAESRLVGDMLTYWAMRSTLDARAMCANGQQPARPALAA